ncbi:MAG: hypothetical protein RL757_2379 [Bacteroidota bacterium]|jgi:iron complex outermembrane receptor protein
MTLSLKNFICVTKPIWFCNAILFAFWINPLFLLAQQKDTLPVVEIRASPLQKFAVGQLSNQIDSTFLELSKNQSLAQTLQFAAPLTIRSYGSGVATAGARGMASNHTVIVWNGVSLQNPLNGILDLNGVDINGLDNITIKQGGGAALFSSGAVGGVIELRQDAPPQYKSRFLDFSMGYGSFSTLNLRLHAGETRARFRHKFSFSHQNSKNDFLFRNIIEIGKPLERAINAGYQKNNFQEHIQIPLNALQTLNIYAWYSASKRGLMPPLLGRNDSATLEDSAFRGIVEWTRNCDTNKTQITKIRTAFLDDRNIYNSDRISNSLNAVRTVLIEAEHNMDWSKYGFVRVGANVTYNQARSNNLETATRENPTRNRMAFFANYRLEKPKLLRFNANFRQEWVDMQAIPTTFSLGMEKDIRFNSSLKTVFRADFSRNFNLPSLNDLYWTQLGNPNLLPEKGWSREAGLSVIYRKENEKIKSKHQLNITFFNIDLNNRILWSPDNIGIWRPRNVTQMKSIGTEISLQNSVTYQKFKTIVSAHYQLANATNKLTNLQLIYTPKHSVSAQLQVNYAQTYVGFQQSYNSKRFMDDANEISTPAFALSNFYIGFSPKYAASRMDIRLQILNLFDNDYQVLQNIPNPKRATNLNFSIKF